MKFQQKRNRWSCITAAFAMVAEIPETLFVKEIGHDGSEILYPTLHSPANRKGFHVQECLEVMMNHGWSCTPIEMMPQSASPLDDHIARVIHFEGGNRERFERYIRSSKGVLECRTRGWGWHALAIDHGRCLDPDGAKYEYELEYLMNSRTLYPVKFWRCERNGQSGTESVALRKAA